MGARARARARGACAACKFVSNGRWCSSGALTAPPAAQALVVRTDDAGGALTIVDIASGTVKDRRPMAAEAAAMNPDGKSIAVRSKLALQVRAHACAAPCVCLCVCVFVYVTTLCFVRACFCM